MNWIFRARQGRIAAAGLSCCVVLVSEVLAVAGASAHASAVSVPRCISSHMEIWLGDGEGGGTLGRTYYPLEFTNIGHHSCTLDGYPRVTAWGRNGRRVGKPATRNTSPHRRVSIAPGATVHALLAIDDAGAICARPVTAFGLMVRAPGQRVAQQIQFTFQACRHASVLQVGPIRRRAGIPGYTTS